MGLFLLSCFALLQQPQNAVQQFSFSPMEMLRHMSWTGIGVMIVLMIMSIYSLAIMAERYLVFRAAARQSRQFAPSGCSTTSPTGFASLKSR